MFLPRLEVYLMLIPLSSFLSPTITESVVSDSVLISQFDQLLRKCHYLIFSSVIKKDEVNISTTKHVYKRRFLFEIGEAKWRSGTSSIIHLFHL